jgi:cell division protease FtsH
MDSEPREDTDHPAKQSNAQKKGPGSPRPSDEMSSRPVRRVNRWMIGLLIILAVTLLFSMFMYESDTSEISYSYFLKLLKGKDYQGNNILDANNDPVTINGPNNKPVQCNIKSVRLAENVATGYFVVEPPKEPAIGAKADKDGETKPVDPDNLLKSKFRVDIGPPDSPTRKELTDRLEERGVQFTNESASGWSAGLILALLIGFSVIMVMLVMSSLRRAQNQMMGGGGFLSSFSRSNAKRYEPSEHPITFKDVAGLEGVKADLKEIVDFLREPEKFQKLGGRVPKGVLLVGPPGTGKTLLARAIAGEAEVPYFSVNGSEFIQMFVGVGASRVRDLFATAKAHSPSIIFVDEIDAVGRQRGAGLGGGHDEREQTLNQILGEMDGFNVSDSVIIVAATNRPDILDPALLRPGRFDRQITVSRPTQKGRLEIFKVHVRDVPLGKDVDLKALASATAGMTGADIQNLVNEAALWAARKNKTKVEMSDFYYAQDKVLMGAKREEVLSESEKERTAYHESGHTLAAWYLKGAHPVHKVTIIPRGRSLGVTQMVPDEDKLNMTEAELKDQLVVALAGRAAEQLIYDELTVGAENDLERATGLARRMITHWGMNDRLGPVSYKMTEEDPFLGREFHQNRQFSELTMQTIDEEAAKTLRESAQRAYNLLKEKRPELETLTKELIVEEELDKKQIEALIGPPVHSKLKSEKSEETMAPDSMPIQSNTNIE